MGSSKTLKNAFKNTPCKNAFKKPPLQNRTNVQIKGGGGSKAFWTMFKKTSLFPRDGFPKGINNNINFDKAPFKGWQDQNEDRFEAELVSQVSKDGTEDES